MERNFSRIAFVVDSFTARLCNALLFVLAGAVLGAVLLRQGLGIGSIWLQDLGGYAFALLAVFALPCSMARDRHVRVDILRQNQPAARQRAVDAIALFFFLLPAWGLLIWYASPLALEAIRLGEGSPQIGGLPGYFVVRAAMPIAIAFFCIQALQRIGQQDRR